MRTSLALLLLAASTPLVRAADLQFFNDAALHAVQFMEDGQEGWAVGDEGAIWHTIDGGKTWDRQHSGVRASLRSVHFLNPLVGWIAGRDELPLGAGSAGVVLVTKDSGESWQPLTMNEMPGLNVIHFLNEKVGYSAGDGTDQYPSGVFMTKDSGRSWNPVPGSRCPGWSAGSFSDSENGALVGRWSHLANFRNGQVIPAVSDTLGGRNLRGMFVPTAKGARSIAVGQGGVILVSDDKGAHWTYPEQRLPPEVLSCWDLHAVHGAGKHFWAAGRPGSALLHSGDGGQNWEMQKTGQPLPINGLYFHDEKTGWAVGELGLILTTRDGGLTWKAQQQGGKRSAVLCVQAHAAGLPADMVTRLAEEGYLSAAVRAVTADTASAPFRRSSEADRLATAIRLAGGAAGESLWQLPLPAHFAHEPREAVVKFWDDIHGGNAGEQVLRQLVLALRIWRPDVVLCGSLESKDASPADTLIAEALKEAFKQAGDPKAFPEQLARLGLSAWKPSKLYAEAADGQPGTVVVSLTDVKARLKGSPREFASPAAGLLAGQAVVLPRKRSFQLLASNLAGAEKHLSLMEGVPAGTAGDSRRIMPLAEAMTPELLKALQSQSNLQEFADTQRPGLADPDRLLGALPKLLDQLPDAQGVLAAHAVASQMIRLGQWAVAREAFLQMIERYPMHPLSADAYRWLIKHNSSSEVRRRYELGQFLMTGETEYKNIQGKQPIAVKQTVVVKPRDKDKGKNKGGTQAKSGDQPSTPTTDIDEEEYAAKVAQHKFQVHATKDQESMVRWPKGGLDLEKQLRAFGPLLSEDPAVRFSLLAAKRNAGDFDTQRPWFASFMARQPAGPWRDAAAAELWLTQREGAPPKPVLTSWQAETKPFLDGKFDDPCWKDQTPVVMSNAAGTTAKEAPTKVMLAYDAEFLYVALRCEHRPGKRVPPVKGRKRDENLQAFDRVTLLLDLDRDYSTAFRFEVDQRGCVRDSCWGDLSWNPSWFVAVNSDETAWQIEAAIPLVSMTGDLITPGKAWCCNVIRTIPGQGVQAWSLPAGMPEEDARLEGMGLLMFKADPRLEAQNQGRKMKRAME